MPQVETLNAHLDRLATFPSSPYPVVSLYLNMQPDQQGRDHYEPFLRKELMTRVQTYPASGPERDSLAQDTEKIRSYLNEVDRSANGLALFTCSGDDLFEAVQLKAPFHDNRLCISDEPHLYPLARVIDEYPRYAVLLADTHSARIFVFAANQLQHAERVEGIKTKRHRMGGWSQARYQRHMENYHLHHAKDVVDILARIVHEESIGAVVVAGDEVIVPLLNDQMPKDLAARIVDVVKLDMRAAEREVFEKSIAAMRGKDAETDRERVEVLLNAYRANDLGCVGVDATRAALELGQVDELVIAATPEIIDAGVHHAGDRPPDRTTEERTADELIAKARQTAAKIRFIEDASLLEPVGGVGAFLRFKL